MWPWTCMSVFFFVTVLLASPLRSNEDQCSADKFMCDGLCSPLHWRCDGLRDCEDGVDEKDCKTGEFNLTSETVSPSIVTEGPLRTDISSSSSSTSTTTPSSATGNTITEISNCSSNTYDCKGGLCIPIAWRCDGDKDCLNGKDEMDCSNRADCSSSEFRCNLGTCIPVAWKCDGDEDCLKGEDELNCSIPMTNTTKTTELPPRTSSTHDRKEIERKEEDRMVSSKCPKDFAFFEGSCIWVNVFPRTWKRAKKICHERNTTLFQFSLDILPLIVPFLEKQFGFDGWIYWVEKPRQTNSSEIVLSKKITIPAWFLNGQNMEERQVSLSSEDCYFLDSTHSKVYKDLSCSDYAGFICEYPASE